MKTNLLLPLLALAAAPAVAAAQDGPPLWADLQASRPLPFLQEGVERGPRGGREVRVAEEWVAPRVRTALTFIGRASFPGDTDVTIDGLTWSDFFNPGLGVGGELDVLTFVTPHWGVGGYVSGGWDRYDGQTVDDVFNDTITPEDMSVSTVIVGGKVLQRVGPFMTWEGRMGVGLVHYCKVDSTFVVGGVTTRDVELFKTSSRAVFEMGGRVGFGSPRLEGNFGLGFRYMGPPGRGDGVTNAIDPELFFTFMIELGLTMRF